MIINYQEFVSNADEEKYVTNYLKEPNEQNFYEILKLLPNNGKLLDIFYVVLGQSTNANELKNLIKSLYACGRFIEVDFFYNKFKDYGFKVDREIARIHAMSCIECGWLASEEELLAECLFLGEARHHELTIRLAFCLKIMNLERAHTLSIELLFEDKCREHGYLPIIDTALHMQDIDLLSTALKDVKHKSLNLHFSKMKENNILNKLRTRLLYILKSLQ